VRGIRLRGEAGAVEHRIHEISRTVTRERTSCAVGAVRARRETEDEHARIWIAETGNGLAPVFPVQVGTAFFKRDLLTVLHQPRTASARDNLTIQSVEPGRHKNGSHRGINAEERVSFYHSSLGHGVGVSGRLTVPQRPL